jgi:hypothetical protein
MISGGSVGPARSSSRILPKTAGDVVEKCIKIFVKMSLEIHNEGSKPTTVLQSFAVGSTKDEHTQLG